MRGIITMYATTSGLLAICIFQIFLQPIECVVRAKSSNAAGKISSQIAKGNIVTNISAFPYHVGIMVNDSLMCNGVLIVDNWVLTSAYCASLSNKLTVVLAALTKESPPSVNMDITPSKIFKHEQYNASTMLNDIALLKLPYTITLKTPFIKTIKHSKDKKELYDGESAVVSGFGITETATSSSLMSVTMNVITNDECSTLAAKTIDPSLVCVASVNNEGPCEEDEGSPLVSTGKKPALIGIFATDKDISCKDELKFKIFTRVLPFDKWIASKISANK